MMPYMFEDADWRSFFWSSLPSSGSAPPATAASANVQEDDDDEDTLPLAKALISALCVRILKG